MATYVIGDLQGCYAELQHLLEHIDFCDADQLWFCGDLVARGPSSLECLQFVRSLGSKAVTVLGNHDLHLIACYYGLSTVKAQDRLQPLFDSPQLDDLIHWLCQQPLLHQTADQKQILVHAGLSPQLSLTQLTEATDDIQSQLRQDPLPLLKLMYGNKPDDVANIRSTEERWRYTINSCTRMRFCRQDGSLELKEKGHPRNQTKLVPWFEFWRGKLQAQLFFGHWAALNGYSPVSNIHALDTGCVWGNSLTAYCIETQQRFSVAGLQ